MLMEYLSPVSYTHLYKRVAISGILKEAMELAVKNKGGVKEW